ncbi:MAG: glycosyltransferase family 2 protein [Acidobacteriota bacterium]|nr:MAG: glycosyltransferase family 2 protein [Acidobacteriota bacterium]
MRPTQPSPLALVSAIIPTLLPERLSALGRAAESVLNQSYPHLEVLVVADGPQATHADTLEERVRDPRLRVVRRSRQGGPGAARNTGAQAAKGKYLAFLDDDDEWLPNKLEVQMELAAEHPEAALIFSDAYMVKDGEKIALLPSIKFQGPPTLEELCERNFIPCLTVLLKRDVFMNVGGFDPSLEIWGFDDWDLWLRVMRFHSAVFNPLPLAIHYRHEDNYSNTIRFLEAQGALLRKQLRLFSDNPRCAAIFREQMMQFESQRGYRMHLEAYFCMLSAQYKEARVCLKRAIRHYPLYLKNYAYLLFTYLPPSAYAAVRRLKRALWP